MELEYLLRILQQRNQTLLEPHESTAYNLTPCFFHINFNFMFPSKGKEEGVSSYWMTFRKRAHTGN
jgi:hypothetical protein